MLRRPWPDAIAMMMTTRTNRKGMQNKNGKNPGKNAPVRVERKIDITATAAITTKTMIARSCGVVLRRGAAGYQLCGGGGCGEGGASTARDWRGA